MPTDALSTGLRGHHHDRDDHDHRHGHGHGHRHGHRGHGHGSPETPTHALRLSLVLTASFMVVEAAAGFWTGGLALLADAAHMLADAAALGLALLAAEWATRPRSVTSTFGYRRAEVLAAFMNGVALAVTAIGIVVEAVNRWQNPHEIRATPMLIAAAVGLAVNIGVAAILSRASRESINVRAAFAHVATDAVGSIGAMSAAAAVLFFDWRRADALVAMGIALLVAWSGWRVLREATGILLEAAPAHLDVVRIDAAIRECPGVQDVHDLHVWRISERFDALTVHVTLAQGHHGVEVCRDVAKTLRDRFGLEHVTVQPEAPVPEELVELRRSQDGPTVRLS